MISYDHTPSSPSPTPPTYSYHPHCTPILRPYLPSSPSRTHPRVRLPQRFEKQPRRPVQRSKSPHPTVGLPSPIRSVARPTPSPRRILQSCVPSRPPLHRLSCQDTA